MILENGVLAFDGEVLEAFTAQGSDRVPASQVELIRPGRGSLIVQCKGFIKPITFPLAKSEAENPELTALLDEVRSASNHMEGQ